VGDSDEQSDEREDSVHDEDWIILPRFISEFANVVDVWFLRRALSYPICTKEAAEHLGAAINDALKEYGVVGAPKFSYDRCRRQREKLPRVGMRIKGNVHMFCLRTMLGWILSIPKYRNHLRIDYETRWAFPLSGALLAFC